MEQVKSISELFLLMLIAGLLKYWFLNQIIAGSKETATESIIPILFVNTVILQNRVGNGSLAWFKSYGVISVFYSKCL